MCPLCPPLGHRVGTNEGAEEETAARDTGGGNSALSSSGENSKAKARLGKEGVVAVRPGKEGVAKARLGKEGVVAVRPRLG